MKSTCKKTGKIIDYLERNKGLFDHTLTTKKIKNLKLAQFEESINSEIVSSLPYIYQVGPTNKCNLRCALCPTKYSDSDMPKGFMEDELYYKIIDKIKDYAIELWLYNWGEPLLHPRITDYISYASKNNIFTLVSTNFSFALTDRKIHSILNSRLGLLHIDIDGIDQEIYKKYRIGGNLDLVLKNLKNIIRIKKELGLKFPIIETAMLVNKYNESSVDEYKLMMKDYGVDKIVENRLQVNPNISKEWLPSNKSTRHENYFRQTEMPPSCSNLYSSMSVNWDGRIAACCTTYDKDSDFDIIKKDTSIEEIWNNKHFRSARNVFNGSDQEIKTICSECKGQLNSNELTHFRDTFAISLRKNI